MLADARRREEKGALPSNRVMPQPGGYRAGAAMRANLSLA
ncbi:hypothetical protein SS05631_c08710 [Sinorhizobium sp. CCBAU 05631]|nr:hypothetical protein SS05631_c08710 [Sinorhizobium sp. CCBAU 05631]